MTVLKEILIVLIVFALGFLAGCRELTMNPDYLMSPDRWAMEE